MNIFAGLSKKLKQQRMGESLSNWEEGILDHYYEEIARAEVADEIRKFKTDYHHLYGEFPDDRIMLALYKCGKSKRDNLAKAIDLALSDSRDLIVAAKFMNNQNAHEEWKAKLMQSIKNRKASEKNKT